MVTTFPPPRSRSSGIAARVVRIAASRVRLRVASQSSSLIDRNPSIRGAERSDVVDHDVETAEVSAARDELGRPVRCGQVDGNSKDLRGRLQVGEFASDVACSGDHRCALVDERACDREADTLARPGDDRDFSCQVEIHGADGMWRAVAVSRTREPIEASGLSWLQKAPIRKGSSAPPQLRLCEVVHR